MFFFSDLNLFGTVTTIPSFKTSTEMYRIPLSAFGIAIPGFHFDFSFGGCPQFLSVSQSLRVQKYPPKWVTVSNSPYSPVKRVFFPAVYQPRFTRKDVPWFSDGFSHGFPMVYWEFLSARDVTPVIHHSHLCEDTLGQLPFVNGLAFLKNFHMHNFCFFFWGGEVGPSQKTLKAFFFWCEKKKQTTASVHQHEE